VATAFLPLVRENLSSGDRQRRGRQPGDRRHWDRDHSRL